MYIQSVIVIPADVNACAFFNAVQTAINAVISAQRTQHDIDVSAYIFDDEGVAIY